MRYTKRSLELAINTAKEMSAKHPSIKYYVLDKPKCSAHCFSLSWALSEYIRDKDYHVHSIYCDGVRIGG